MMGFKLKLCQRGGLICLTSGSQTEFLAFFKTSVLHHRSATSLNLMLNCLKINWAFQLFIITKLCQNSCKTLALLTFPEDLIKFQTWIKGGLCRLGCKELGVLSVCLPPTEPVLWFLRDRALYLKCVRVAFCFWRSRWAASGPAVQRAAAAAASQRPHSTCTRRLCLFARSLKHVLPSPRTPLPPTAPTNARSDSTGWSAVRILRTWVMLQRADKRVRLCIKDTGRREGRSFAGRRLGDNIDLPDK